MGTSAPHAAHGLPEAAATGTQATAITPPQAHAVYTRVASPTPGRQGTLQFVPMCHVRCCGDSGCPGRSCRPAGPPSRISWLPKQTHDSSQYLTHSTPVPNSCIFILQSDTLSAVMFFERGPIFGTQSDRRWQAGDFHTGGPGVSCVVACAPSCARRYAACNLPQYSTNL